MRIILCKIYVENGGLRAASPLRIDFTIVRGHSPPAAATIACLPADYRPKLLLKL